MAATASVKKQQHKSKEKWTAFDRALISAARDQTHVSLWFGSPKDVFNSGNTGGSSNGTEDFVGVVLQVDRYFIKVAAWNTMNYGDKKDIETSFWIAKSLIAAVWIDEN